MTAAKHHRRLLRTADTLEPKLARTFIAGTRRVQRDVSVETLARAITKGGAKAVVALLQARVPAALDDAQQVVQDAVVAGGHHGADQVNR